jgi:hypothetical protein
LTDVISQSLNRAYEDAYYSEVHKSIEKALSDYGEVLRLNYEGALIRVNLLHFTNDIDSNKVLSTAGQVKDELYNLFYEEEKLTKPELYINDDYISIDDSVFADSFYELCSEYDIPIKK